MRSMLITMGALAAVAAVVPATSASAHINVAVSSVAVHTERADAGLDRAIKLFEQNADRSGSRELSRSRRELDRATAESAKLRRTAKTRNQRASAAGAAALVAGQQDGNVEVLVGVLDEVTSRIENTVAKTALFDTRGREKAIAVINAVLSGNRVSVQAKRGLARALTSLARDRDEEALREVQALVDSDVSSSAKRTVVRTLIANVEGQSRASNKLLELIADEDVPSQSKPGLQRAQNAVSAEHGSIADILSRFSDRMPAEVRSLVQQVVTRARTDAQSMRENRPTPPVGGAPMTTPGPGGPPFAR